MKKERKENNRNLTGNIMDFTLLLQNVIFCKKLEHFFALSNLK